MIINSHGTGRDGGKQQQHLQMTMNDDMQGLYGKNVFNYMGNSNRDNMSHSFNYSDYS